MSEKATKSNINPNFKQLSKSTDIISSQFQNKQIFQKIISFMTSKQKFLIFSNSRALMSEYDIKIEDCFIPRKYQEKIKSYTKNYEDLFYKIMLEMKKEKESNGKKICLYEIENDMIKYLKYLTEKYDKIIPISLIFANDIEIWKLDFISKLLETLEKNIHLKLCLNYHEIRAHEIYGYICRFSKAINILEIVDVYKNNKNSKFEGIIPCFNWSTIYKLIINLSDYAPETNITKNLLIHVLNTINAPNLEELDLRCNFINFHILESFFENNGKTIKKLELTNYEIINDTEIDNNNSLISYLKNLKELSFIIEENNLEKILCFFYPIFPKIKKFNLVIKDNEDQNEYEIQEKNDKKVEEENNQKKDKKSKDKLKKRNKTKNNLTDKKNEKENALIKFGINQLNYMSEIPNYDYAPIDNLIDEDTSNDFEKSKNINLRKITFTSEKKEIKKNVHNKKQNNNYLFLSSLSNLSNCESLKYEIRTNNLYFIDKNRINTLSYLIDLLEVNNNNLHYLEIYINNNELNPMNIYDFELLIKAISKCKKLNTFIFEYELKGEYTSIFNNLFNVGDNLTHLSLMHDSELDFVKIISEHEYLTNIKFELLSENFENFYYDFDIKRNWESIDLTNYPIYQSIVDLFKSNKNINYFLDSCANCDDLDENSMNDLLKNCGNRSQWKN